MPDSSSEYTSDSSSEDEAPRQLLLRPKFIPKSQRNKSSTATATATTAAPATNAGTDTADDPTPADAPLSPKSSRQAALDALVESQIKKDLAERQTAKKHWEDDPDGGAHGTDADASDVDTTDGLDPEAEEAAWRLRELQRLRRARLLIEAREAENAEKERRQNLTEEERAAEDEAHLASQRADKDSRGKMAYMQRYFHKGAFFRDDGEAMGLLQRDIMGTRIADDVKNRSALPEYLQRRDMAKLGRRGATKYKDMRSEDTGRWGEWDGRPRRDGDRGGFGGRDEDDERFRRDYDGEGGKGANAMPLGERRPRRDDDRDRRDDRRDRRDDERDDRRHRSRDRGQDRRDDHGRRSRSRSPRRDDRRTSKRYDSRSPERSPKRYDKSPRRDDHGRRDDYRIRKRSNSRDRHGNDKRRRVDTR